MKTKMLITLSICLILFACGEKKPPEKKVKQKTVTKTPEKPKLETKKEKVLEALPAKKDEHVHSPGCGHDHGAADSEHVSIMATAQEERMKLAEMLPDEIRKKILKMVDKRDINGLAEMCNQLSRMGNYKDAFLIASNFLAHAETETEKQMAASFYGNLSAQAFCKDYRSLNESNKAEFENVKNLLIESLENTPENHDNISQAYLVNESLIQLSQVLLHNIDTDFKYEMYDAYKYKTKGISKAFFDVTENCVFMNAYMVMQYPKNYKKIKITDENLNRMIEYTDKMISGKISPCGDSPSRLQRMKNDFQKFKEYRQNKTYK